MAICAALFVSGDEIQRMEADVRGFGEVFQALLHAETQ
jgi:hypothetical protein